MRRLRGTHGLTLVELAVAVLVLSIGTLAALRSLDISTKGAAGAEARALAQIALQNRAAELRLYGPGAALPAQVEMAGRALTIAQEVEITAGGLAQIRLTAQAPGAAGAQLVIFVDPGPRE